MGFCPFQVVYGVILRGPVDLSTLPDCTRLLGDATIFVEALSDVHQQAIANLETSSSKYKAAADVHRRRLVFEVGDLVWAYFTRDRMPARTYNKLKSKKFGPLEVLERINDNAYRLKLPADINSSDVFNLKALVSLCSRQYRF